jgi:hypothetical protein
MSECLLRFHEVTTNVPVPPILAAIATLKEQDERKEERRQRQMALAGDRKRKAEDEGDDAGAAGTETGAETPDLRQAPAKKDGAGGGKGPTHKKRGQPVPYGTTLSRPVQEARGHTSYLTFATLLPVGLRGGEGAEAAQEGEAAAKALAAVEKAATTTSAAAKTSAEEDDMEGFDDGMDEAIGALSEEDLQRLLGSSSAPSATSTAPPPATA